MKINDVILEKAAAKPRNFVAKNAMKTTSGAGKHKDKKKAQKQGYEKHKTKSVSESLRPGEYHIATVTLDDGTVKKVKVFSDEGFRDHIQQTFAKQGQRVKDIKMDYGVYGESMDEAQDDWGSMSHSEFKRKELQHELGHEDHPEFQRQMREKDRGPWYIKINGKIYRQRSEPKVFDWKKAANNYALAMLKNKPQLKSKTVLTRKPVDEMQETATAEATSAANVSVGAVYKNKKGQTYKNPDGTAKNALDVKGANLLTGGSVAKR